MAVTGLYTCDELIQKLKDLNDRLDDATTKSKIDTSQSSHEYSESIRTLREQYDKYLSMLARQCPSKYRAFMGPDVIRFGGSSCS